MSCGEATHACQSIDEIMSELDETLREFLIEGHESLGQIEQLMLSMENDATRADAVSGCFRLLHSIKGACGFLGLRHLEELSHAAESLLASIRSGEIAAGTSHINWLLQAVDGLKKLLALIETDGSDNAGAATVSQILANRSSYSQQAEPVKAPSTVPMRITAEIAHIHPNPPSGTSIKHDDIPAGASMLAEATVRIGVEVIDRLMALASELVLARNRIMQASDQIEDAGYQAATRQLNLVTSELQEVVMRTRMQPIANVWSKLPRMVRDLSRQIGKQCRLDLEGGETELDKTLLEAIKAPLTHLARNSVDHGIELPSIRMGLGKPAEGKIVLRASHEAGQVTIEMSDDGRGIDTDRIRAKVLSQRLATSDDLARLSDSQIMQYVFMPGFSTADRVTEISGRGVGMDVVKNSIESLGGSIDLSSTLGTGAVVRLRLPLTLAIIKALIVSAGNSAVALPQAGIVELMRLEGERRTRALTHVGDAVYLRFRSELLPLIDLAKTMGIPCSQESDTDAFSVVVVHAENRQFALRVNKILDSQEIVVKPLPSLLKGIPAYSGITLLGDGAIALIVDPVGVARLAGLQGRRNQAIRDDSKTPELTKNTRPLLLVETTRNRMQAIPLESVDRLEVFPVNRLEHTDDTPVVQYRGGILPLYDTSGHPGCPFDAERWTSGTVSVVVHQTPHGLKGLVVARIVDTVIESVEETGGMTIIRGSVTQIVVPETWLAGVPQ